MNGASWNIVPAAATTGTIEIQITGGTQAEREAVLDGFTLTPPAHSSLDASVDISVTTSDTNSDTGMSDTATVILPLDIVVTPVAEVVSTDTDGSTIDDLTLTPGAVYTT